MGWRSCIATLNEYRFGAISAGAELFESGAISRSMQIWIDESGSFTGLGKMPSPSCVGALIIPDAKVPEMLRLYARLRPKLPMDKGEVKGRLLTARDVVEVVVLLRRVEALFEIAVIDLGMHSLEDLKSYQERFAHAFGANITPEHNEALRKQVADAQAALRAMKPPLFVQTVLNYEVLKTTFEHATNYMCQRRPEELGCFKWVVDGKEPLAEKTPWEAWWSSMIMPIMQAKSMQQPVRRVEGKGFDYSHLDQAFGMDHPEYLREHLTPEEWERGGTNIFKIFGDNVQFSTDPEPGLELVDILTNAVRRALVGHLEPEGWKQVRTIMIHRRDHYISMCRLTAAGARVPRVPYRDVLIAFKTGGKLMVTPRNRR